MVKKEEIQSIIQEAKEKGFTRINLAYCGLNDIPDEIFDFKNLTVLNISYNPITKITPKIAQLTEITHLYITNTNIDELPDEICKLSKLKGLNLNQNKRLKKLPENFGNLSNIEILTANNCALTSLPESFSQLENLRFVQLAYNKLKGNIPLPKSKYLAIFNIDGNEIKPEETTYDKEFIRDIQKGSQLRYEGKLIIVGSPGSGKTSLLKKLVNLGYILKEEDSTHGIDIETWEFPFDKEHKFITSIWDFGGQEIYHSTHQFFLTRRALYLLVADARKEDTNFEYWLNLIKTLGDNSPVIIAKNKSDLYRLEVSEKSMQEKYNFIKEFITTSCKTDEGINQLRNSIQNELKSLDGVGQELPISWINVKAAIQSTAEDYISFEEFEKICDSYNVKESAKAISEYLHETGKIIHFLDNLLLRNYVFLKPNWCTCAVYNILATEKIRDEKKGNFDMHDLDNIFQNPKIKMLGTNKLPNIPRDMYPAIVELMKRFRICYQINNNYVAPQLLPAEQPPYEWNESDNIVIKYDYEFMPKGLMTRLIVELHPYIKHQWRNGVVIKHGNVNAIAEIKEDYYGRNITLRVSSSSSRDKYDCFSFISKAIEKINEEFKNLKVTQLIQCKCQKKEFYEVKDRLFLWEQGEKDFLCSRAQKRIALRDMLIDILPPEPIGMIWARVKEKLHTLDDDLRKVIEAHFTDLSNEEVLNAFYAFLNYAEPKRLVQMLLDIDKFLARVNDEAYVKQLIHNVEPFLKKILFITNKPKYEELNNKIGLKKTIEVLGLEVLDDIDEEVIIKSFKDLIKVRNKITHDLSYEASPFEVAENGYNALFVCIYAIIHCYNELGSKIIPNFVCKVPLNVGGNVPLNVGDIVTCTVRNIKSQLSLVFLEPIGDKPAAVHFKMLNGINPNQLSRGSKIEGKVVGFTPDGKVQIEAIKILIET